MKISKIINKLFTVVVFAVVLLIVVSVLPIPGNYKLLIVQSGSMEPAIKTGSVVAVKPVENYKANDVITFEDGGKSKTTTHRIVDTEVVSGKVFYITKGDANNAEDSSKVPEDKIVGKVLTSVPYVGYILAMAKEPAGFVLLVIIPCVIIILEEVGKIWKEVKKGKKEKKDTESDTELTL
ncbi:signal peptidase I [Patescibacteria group bacterium]|nr:signal peptidase I [Patescibacteria group bacterium]